MGNSTARLTHTLDNPLGDKLHTFKLPGTISEENKFSESLAPNQFELMN